MSTSEPYHIIILGAYGNFGTRIAKRLANDPNIALILAGRNLAKAQAFARQLPNAEAVQLDANDADFVTKLSSINADLLIHTAGPFQGQDYQVAKAAAKVGIHYIDLADGRRFVCEFKFAMHDMFSHAGKLAITGASTVPALSSAVIDALIQDLIAIESIETCIAPAQQAPRGLATLQAVLGYCGEPIRLWQNGQWVNGFGWLETKRLTFSRMKPRLGALCDIPDLELFAQHYPGVKTVMFRAALEVGITQRIFALLAYLRKHQLLPNLAQLAPLLHHTAPWFDRFGSALGGMVVKVRGISKEHKTITREWHIAADHNYGPEIPCMAAVLLAKKLAKGEMSLAGAYPCVSLLTLQEFETEFAVWGMQTDTLST